MSTSPTYAPVLTASQIQRIGAVALRRDVLSEQILYEPGDDTPPVFVVLSGGIRILAVSGGQERTVTTYGVGQFSGELLMISGRKSIYRCQAIESGTLLELSAKDLRTLIAKDAELSDIFMKAFLTRRLSEGAWARERAYPGLPLFRSNARGPRISCA